MDPEHLLYVMKHPAGLLFLKNNNSENSKHARFADIVLFVIFGQNITKISSEYHPQDARCVSREGPETSETEKVDLDL